MNKTLIICLSCVAFFIVVLAIIALISLGIYNTEIELSNQFKSQENKVETTMDNMRKILTAQFKVTTEFADKFIASVKVQSDSRTGGALFKSVQESNSLGISSELYSKMFNSIAGKMDEFTREQNVLTDIWNIHESYCMKFPNTILIGSKRFPKPIMISSDEVKEAMKTKVFNHL